MSYFLRRILLPLISLLLAPIAIANQCPSLEGFWSCPKVGDQPAAVWMVVQGTANEVTTYRSLWTFGYASDVKASDGGETTADGFLVKCVKNCRYFGKPETWGDATVTFVNRAGDVESRVRGKRVNICRRALVFAPK